MPERRNRIGICEWSLPVSGPEACKMIASLGIEGIQLNIGDARKGFPLSEKTLQDAYLKAADEFGVEFPSIAVRTTDYFSMMAPEESDERKKVMTAIEKAIDAAAAMKVPLVMIPQFLKSAIKSESDFHCVVNTLKKVCDDAVEKGVTIATENLLHVEELKRLFNEVDRKNLKLYFDTQNYYLNKDFDTPSLIEPLMPYICEVHVKDGKNKDLSGALLGTGDTGFYQSMEKLMSLGYSGWLIFENYYDQPPLSLISNNPSELILQDVKTLKEALKD